MEQFSERARGQKSIHIRDPNGVHTINIEQGLYDYQSLYQQIALEMNYKDPEPNLYWRFEDMFAPFIGNYTTQKLTLTFLYIQNADLDKNLVHRPLRT